MMAISWIAFVTRLADAGEDIVGEFIEGADLAFFLGHADVAS